MTGPKWQGCVGSREYPANSKDTQIGGDIPGFMGSDCAQPITRLTADGASLLSAIDGYVSSGETYIAPALLWGARAISDNIPFPDGSSDSETRKAIVLMSDGTNTVSKNAEEMRHDGMDRAASDTLLLEICQTIKDGGITLYTVAYSIDDAAGRQLLEDCASEGANMFFDAQTDSQLIDSFEAITNGFGTVRISQ